MAMQKRRVWIYVLMFLLSAINYIDRSALSVAAAPLSHEFGLDPVQLGYLFSSFLWLYVLCLVPMGMIVDRMGSRTVNGVGIAVWSAATLLTGVVGSFAALIGTRILMGAGEATTYPAAGRVVREWVPVRERALFVTVFNSGAYFGPAIGGLVLTWLVGVAGWRAAFFASGAIGFVWLAAWLIWFRQPELVGWLGAEERAMILRERDAQVAVAGQAQTSLGVGMLLRSRSLLGMMLTQGCAVYTQYLFLTWLPNYLQAARGISMVKSGALTAMPYLGAVVLTVLFGKISDMLLTQETVRSGGRRRMVALAMLVSSAILLTPFVDSVYGILFLIMIALSGVATTVGLNIALLNDLLRSSGDAGRATGLLILGGNIFGIMAPIVTGYVIQTTGSFNYAFVIAGTLLVCGSLSALLLTSRPIVGAPRLAPSMAPIT
jgi:ACS family glucarate transporter-like MFS transporter